MTLSPVNGLVNVPSQQPVDVVVEKFENIFAAKGIKLFALIDHSGEASKAGLHMPPTKLLVFGNPQAGTPLMIAAPSIAIDLPMKILVWQDISGKVWISYNTPSYLQSRHGLPEQLLQSLEVIESLVAKVALANE